MKVFELNQRMSFLLRTIFCLFFLTGNCMIIKSFAQSDKKYLVKIDCRMTYNNIDVRELGHLKMYLSGDYLLEEISTTINRRYFTLDKDSKIMPDLEIPTTSSDSLVKYILTDTKLNHCVEFNLTNEPKVINTYPFSEKKTGLLDLDVAPAQIGKEESKNFYFVKNTIINGFKYIILEDTSKLQINNKICPKMIVHINKDLPDFPLHFINKTLDNKYKGISTRIEFYDDQNNPFVMEWIITKEIPQEKRAWIEKYITIYNQFKVDKK